VNKIGRRVCDVIADGDVLDCSLESLERSIVSGPRVINTLSSGTEGHGKVQDGLSLSMFMNYPEPNRAGSHGTSGVGVVIVLECSLRVVNYLWVGRRRCRGRSVDAPWAEGCHLHYAGGD
jgi:hypothetical protein